MNDIESLLIPPSNELLFCDMIIVCLKVTVEFLSKQYHKSFDTVEASSQSLLTSVRQHTMSAESIISEFCERRNLAPNDYISSISDIIKAERNKNREFIDLNTKQLTDYLKLALTYRREKTILKKFRHQEAVDENARNYQGEGLQTGNEDENQDPEKIKTLHIRQFLLCRLNI